MDIQASSSFVRNAMKAPYLERDQEHELAVRWKEHQDTDALSQLTISHMRLVIATAAKFKRYGLSMADMIQEGHVGLLEAAARFEPEREVRFSTYATWWIRASIQDYILRNWSIVRGGTSSAQKALFFNLRRLRAKLTTGDETINAHEIYSEIAMAVGVKQADVAMMDYRLSGPDTSLNITVGNDEEGQERMSFLPCPDPTPEVLVGDAMDAERRLSWLKQAMTVLNERELHIVRERRLSDEGATLEALGEKLGISKERVRQIEGRAMEKLRHALLELAPQGALGAQ